MDLLSWPRTLWRGSGPLELLLELDSCGTVVRVLVRQLTGLLTQVSVAVWTVVDHLLGVDRRTGGHAGKDAIRGGAARGSMGRR
jgi:hypothetical protein